MEVRGLRLQNQIATISLFASNEYGNIRELTYSPFLARLKQSNDDQFTSVKTITNNIPFSNKVYMNETHRMPC